MRAALIVNVPFVLGTLAASAAVLGLLAGSGRWTLFWILLFLDAYFVIALPVELWLTYHRARRRG